MMSEYILGYANGYEDGKAGRRGQDHPQRSSYNAGYDHGHEDGTYNEAPDYTRDDLDGFRRLEDSPRNLHALQKRIKQECSETVSINMGF